MLALVIGSFGARSHTIPNNVGAAVSNAMRRYLIRDELGSVVLVTNNSRVAIQHNTYDEYGVPGSGNLGRFQYTGQTWIAEAGLYSL